MALFDSGEDFLSFALAGCLRALPFEVFFAGLVFFDGLDFRAAFLATIASLLAVLRELRAEDMNR